MKFTDEILTAINIMTDNGFDVYAVGGCVRDHLMGTLPHDFDLTTNATPEQTLRCFDGYRCFDAGLKHGTVSVVINDEVIEITTFRIEGKYSDNRHPDSVIFTTDLTEDLKRRDFTVNAIVYSHITGQFHDPFSGMADINNNIIRAVGNPDERFLEDGLRILRGLRFASVLGFEIEDNTKDAIHRQKDLLKNISAERIYTEFTKLICGKNVRQIMSEFYDVIAVFLPEILPSVDFDQRNIHHCYDVYEHTLVTMENIDADPILRYTMLFHDLGKPKSFSIDENGGHFYAHHKISTEITKTALLRLKASNEMINTVSTLVYHHDKVIPETEKSVCRVLMKLGEENTRRLFKINRADAMGQAPHQYAERMARIDNLEATLEQVISANLCFSLKDLEINGNDLIKIGYVPGKSIGNTLNILLEEVIDNITENKKEALIKRAHELK